MFEEKDWLKLLQHPYHVILPDRQLHLERMFLEKFVVEKDTFRIRLHPNKLPFECFCKITKFR